MNHFYLKLNKRPRARSKREGCCDEAFEAYAGGQSVNGRAVEKSEHRRVEAQETVSLLNEVAGKSKREVEKLLLSKAPELAIPRERVREISENLTEIRLIVDQELVSLLDEAKTLFGCATQAETMKRTLKVAIESRKKALGLSPCTRPAAFDKKSITRSRYVPIQTRKLIWNRAKSQCEYEHHGKRCLSLHKLQMDHIKPRALGGTAETQNLSLLCANHNLAEARKAGLLAPTLN